MSDNEEIEDGAPVEEVSVEIDPADEPEPTNILKEEIAAEGLNTIARTASGASYAFTKLDLPGKAIDDLGVALRCYEHLRNIDLSKNELRNFDEIIHLPVLTSVNVDENKIKDVRFLKENKDALAYLTVSI